jgi:SRSO17 transposase
MTYEAGAPEMARLDGFLARVTGSLRDHRSRASFAVYAFGLLTEGERKSMEPIAARMCECPDDHREMQHAHDRMINLISRAEWRDEPVRAEAVAYALEAVRARGEKIEVSIIDDTGFLKQGKHSPGVHRQYTGSAGKTANCQVAVSLTVASRSTHVPVDMELYLPQAWTDDRARCRAAKIPDDIGYRPKWQMALLMLERAKSRGIPLGVALADSAYGNVGEFRAGLLLLGLSYAVGIRSTTTVTPLDSSGRARDSIKVSDLATQLPKKVFRKVTWREGSARALCSRFARRRVRVGDVEQELIIEWPEGEPQPTDFSLVALSGCPLSTKQMVRILKQRWRTERVYEDMKGELGLDHFEGRSWRGWNHHVTLALCCYAFVVAEQLRHFSLTTRGARWDDPLAPAA